MIKAQQSGRNQVSFAVYKEKLTSIRIEHAYVFKAKGRFQWLQNLLWKALNKLGCVFEYFDDKIEVDRIVIDTEDFTNRLWKQYYSAKSYYKPTAVYMGPNEFDELARLNYQNRIPFTFDIKMGYNGTLFSLPVTVVPHMEGVLIV